jgi:hypothetical protein
LTTNINMFYFTQWCLLKVVEATNVKKIFNVFYVFYEILQRCADCKLEFQKQNIQEVPMIIVLRKQSSFVLD